MRRAGAAIALVLTGLAGCTSGPGDLPGVGELGVRITEGEGTGPAFRDSVTVRQDNVIQLRVEVAQGERVELSLPTEPALEVEVVARGDDDSRDEVTVSSATGNPFTLERPSEFTPGYGGIEHLDEEGRTVLRLSAPRTAGADQRHVEFTLKVDVG
jgi:hypothetical protein